MIFSLEWQDKRLNIYLNKLHAMYQLYIYDVDKFKIISKLEDNIIPEFIFKELEERQRVSVYEKYLLSLEQVRILRIQNQLIYDTFNQSLLYHLQNNYRSQILNYVLSETAFKIRSQIRLEIGLREKRGHKDPKYCDEIEVRS